MPDLHYLRVSSADVVVRAGLNGVPVIEDRVGGGIVTVEPVNIWLRPEENRLSVWVGVSPSQPNPFAGRASIEVFRHDPSEEVPTPSEVLASFTWPPQETTGNLSLPLTIDLPLEPEPDIPFTLGLWRDAAVVYELDENDRAEILLLVEDLRRAAMSERVSEVLAYLRRRYDDEALAEGRSPDGVRRIVIDMWTWLFGLSGPLLSEPIAPELATFEVAGDGFVVLVGRADAEAAVVLEKPEAEMAFGIPVIVSKVGGRWAITR